MADRASQNAAMGPLPMPLRVCSVPNARTVVLIRSVPSLPSDANSTSSNAPASRYSAAKICHICAASTSPPSPSVCRWMTWLNSICSRRGRSRWWSAFMM